MRFLQKDFEIPQVCLDLGFEDRSYYVEEATARSARMYNPDLDLTLWVDPSAGERRYVLRGCSNGDIIGNCETDFELRELVASARNVELVAGL